MRAACPYFHGYVLTVVAVVCLFSQRLHATLENIELENIEEDESFCKSFEKLSGQT